MLVQVPLSDIKEYMYSVKVTDRSKRSNYTVKKLNTGTKFEGIEQIKEALSLSLDFVPSEFGYIQPGHGMQRWLHDNDDVEQMYTFSPKKKDIVLWCFTAPSNGDSHGKKRPSESGLEASKPKSACLKKIEDVEIIVNELKEKHKNTYSIEQFNTWAHLIHIGKHGSNETPPDLPFFRGIRRRKSSPSSLTASSPTKSGEQGSVVGVSPGKRVSLRSECISQLDKWHAHLEKGVVSQEQYEEVQKTIMNDVMTF